jgi:nucleoside-diphosphate-sugar epimerase
MHRVASEGTANLLESCAQLSKAPVVIHVGSGFEYAPHASAINEDWPLEPPARSYGAAKVAASTVAGSFADRLGIAVLRPFQLYGSGEGAARLGPFMIARARHGDAVDLSACEQQRDFLHVDDCAAMLWDELRRMSGQPGLTVRNLGTGQALRLRDYVEAVCQRLGAHGHDPVCNFGVLPYRESEPMISLPDISRWRADGGRPARITLLQGVADLVRTELAR